MNIDELKAKFSVTRTVRSDEYANKMVLLLDKHVNTVQESNSPKLVFAAGQPGSGKTALIHKILKDYPDEQFVVIDIDEYRVHHPDFDELKQYKNEVINFTNGFLFDMEEDVLLSAIKGKKNIIYVGTLRDTDFAVNFIIKNAKDNGYKISVYALAVSLIESLLSTQERYEQQLSTNAPIAHFVDFGFHNSATTGYETTLEFLEDNNLADDIKVLVRGKNPESDPIPVDFNSDIVPVIKKHREVVKDKSNLRTRLNKLMQEKISRNASDQEVQVIRDIENYLETL